MNSFKLAIFNVKNNIKLFKFNIISMIFSIAVFFNFFSLIFNPSLNLVGSDKLLIKLTLYMTSILLIFFILFFIFYSNSFFLNQRKKEIGIYTFMGIDNSKVAIVFAMEEMLLGVSSLILGLLFGVIFQKSFLMLLSKVSNFRKEVTFYLSIKSIIITCGVFILLFSLSALKGYISILKSKLIDLLNAEKYEDKLLKTRYLTGVMSIVLIGVSYIYSRDMFNESFFTNSSIIMLCIILGTFLLFSSFLSIVIKFMKDRKKILYNGTNIISISNIAYRIRYNYKTLACITLIVAATITALGASLSVQHIFKTSIKIGYPYSFSYVAEDDKVKEKVLGDIYNSKHQVLLNIETKYLLFDSKKYTMSIENHPVIKLSDFNRIINSLKVSNLETIINASKELKDGIAISVASTNDSGFKDNQLLNMYGFNIKIKQTISAPLLGAKFDTNTIILTDNDYNKFRDNCNKLETPEKEHTFNGILVSNQSDSLELSKKLADIPELKNNLKSYIQYYNSNYEILGVVGFTGVFLGVVFMLTTASIMYMKLMSDAIGDKKKYEILMKIGMNERELYRAVAKQVGLSYALPLLLGTVYAFMAIGALQEFLNKYYELSLVQPFLISLGIYSVVYVVFYLLTIRKFIDLVTT